MGRIEGTGTDATYAHSIHRTASGSTYVPGASEGSGKWYIDGSSLLLQVLRRFVCCYLAAADFVVRSTTLARVQRGGVKAARRLYATLASSIETWLGSYSRPRSKLVANPGKSGTAVAALASAVPARFFMKVVYNYYYCTHERT